VLGIGVFGGGCDSVEVSEELSLSLEPREMKSGNDDGLRRSWTIQSRS
jgi:hypothetical protein